MTLISFFVITCRPAAVFALHEALPASLIAFATTFVYDKVKTKK